MCNNWYHHWVTGATLDDQLWHQALVMDHVLESLCGSEQGPNDTMMWTVSVPLATLVQTSLELYRSSMVLAGSYLQRVYTDLYSG